MIAQFTANGGYPSGLYDVDNFGWLLEDASLGSNGYWSVGSNGRGDLQFPYLQTTSNSDIGSLDLTFYVLDPSSAVFIETDPYQTATGLFLQQNAAAAPMTAAKSRFVPMIAAHP